MLLRNVKISNLDLVYFLIHPYCHHSLEQWPNVKLGPQLFSPYKVFEQTMSMSYRLTHLMFHPMFHVSQLKQVFGTTSHIQANPLNLDEELY